MSNEYFPGTPLIRSGANPYAITPVHRIQFPNLPIEARNKFKKILQEKLQETEKTNSSILEHLGQNFDVLG
ncbi:MAG: hypothetical protein ACM3UU_12255 [Ignavibacteriales bacterium]